MKNTLIRIISVLLVIVLLSGCGAGETAAKETAVAYVFEYKPEYVPVEMLSFEDIKYVRPDIDGMHALVTQLEGALQLERNHEQVCSLIDSFKARCTEFETMYAVANIRACKDVTDEYYDKEYSYCMAADAEVELMVDELYSLCSGSSYAEWLEANLFWEGFVEESRVNDFAESQDNSDKYLELAEREAELLAKYRDIVSSPTVEIGGQEQDFEQYLQVDYYGAYAAYFEKYNPMLAQLYIELMEIRRESAQLMGYESYADYAGEYIYGRDFNTQEAKEYLSCVKEHLGPLSRDVRSSGIEYNVKYDSVYGRDLELYLETLAEGLGGKVEEALEQMQQYSLCDLDPGANKAGISFVDYLSYYDVPYLFMNPSGYTDDIMVMSHEFGHFVDSYIRKDAYESIDLAELYSQAMQLMSIDQFRSVMAEDEQENYIAMTMLDMLSSLRDQAALAEFELRACEMEEPTAEKLNALFGEITKAYGIYGDEDEFFVPGWVDIAHFFENPFYVISYSVSASAALELYEMELEEKGSGMDCFVKMSESLMPTLREATEYAGIEDPLSENRVRSAAEFLRSQLKL